MQENTTLASETKQPHPGAASAPPEPGSRAEGKAESAPVPLRGNSPTPPKNKIKPPKENPKKGGEKKSSESQRLENPLGVCEDERSLRVRPASPAPSESSWGHLEQHPSIPPGHPIPISRSQRALGAGQPQHSAGSSRRGWDKHRSKGQRHPCSAVLSWDGFLESGEATAALLSLVRTPCLW